MLSAIMLRYQSVKLCYQEQGRHYHGQNYVPAILDALRPIEDRIHNIPAIELALWWSKSKFVATDPVKTVKDSMIKLAEDMGGLACPVLIRRAHGFMASAADSEMAASNGVPADTDTQYLIDATLAIFGSNPLVFAQYEAGLQAECSVATPISQYRLVRLAVIRRHLRRPSIYTTEYFRTVYEHQARINLTDLETSLVRSITSDQTSRRDQRANDH